MSESYFEPGETEPQGDKWTPEQYRDYLASQAQKTGRNPRTEKDHTKANRGKFLELITIQQCDRYRREKIGIFHKVPTEMIPIRDAVGKIVNCVIKKDQKSAVDFMGRAYNRPIAFDAKQVTSEDRIYFNRVEPDQEEFLDAWIQDGYSIGFILLGFTKENSYWVIPWVLWKWLKEQGNRGGKSLKLEMARTIMPELEIKQPGGGKTSVDFLPVTKRVFKIPEAPPIEKFEFKLMQGGLFDGVQS